MKKLMCLISIMLLSACSHYQWVKHGATESEFNRDKNECISSSYSSVPVQNQPIINPYAQSASSNTQCFSMGAYIDCKTAHQPASETQYTDANIYARNDWQERCMMGKGYRKMQVER